MADKNMRRLLGTGAAAVFTAAALCITLPAGTAGAQQEYADWNEGAEMETETEIPVMDAVPKSGSLHGFVPTAERELEKLRAVEEIITEVTYLTDPFSKDSPTEMEEAETKAAETAPPDNGNAETAPETEDNPAENREGEDAEPDETEDLSEDLTEAEDMKWKKEEFSDIGLTVEIPEMCAVEDAEDKGYRYIYLGKSNEIIPYIILGTWENVDMNIFSDVFLDYMKGHFSDIVVSQDETPVIINNHQMYKWVYEYTLTGARCRDTRIAWPVGNGRIFLFGSKEIPEMRYTLGNLLMKVVESAEYEDDGSEWVKGTVEGNTYRSDTFGVEALLPEDWRFETVEEISGIAPLVRNLAGDEGFPEYAVQDASQYEASAVNKDGTLRWNIVLQDFMGYALEDTVTEADMEMLVEETIERAKGFTRDGLILYFFDLAENGVMNFCEKAARFALVETTCGDTKVWQRTLILPFGETAVMYLTVTTEGEDRTLDVLNMFRVPEEEEAETETETETPGGMPLEENPAGTVSSILHPEKKDG